MSLFDHLVKEYQTALTGEADKLLAVWRTGLQQAAQAHRREWSSPAYSDAQLPAVLDAVDRLKTDNPKLGMKLNQTPDRYIPSGTYVHFWGWAGQPKPSAENTIVEAAMADGPGWDQ